MDDLGFTELKHSSPGVYWSIQIDRGALYTLCQKIIDFPREGALQCTCAAGTLGLTKKYPGGYSGRKFLRRVQGREGHTSKFSRIDES
jgi:hypothetical protein